MRTFRAIAAATFLVPALHQATSAQSGFAQFLGSITPPPAITPGEMTFGSVAVEGNMAVVGRTGVGVNIVDIGDPANPVVILKWEPNAYACGSVCDQSTNPMQHLDIADVKLKDGFGYFATSGWTGACAEASGMYIVDLRPGSATFGKVMSHITDGSGGGSGNMNTIAFHTINLAKIGGNEYLFLQGIEDAEPFLQNPPPRTKEQCDISPRYVPEIRVFKVNNKSAPVYEGKILTQHWVHDATIVERKVGTANKTFILTSGHLANNGCYNNIAASEKPGCTEIYDITTIDAPLFGNRRTLTNQPPRWVNSINTGHATHSSAVSEDGKYLYVAHEVFNTNPPQGKLSVYNLNLAVGASCTWVKDFNPNDFGITPNANMHEAYVQGPYLITTWYEGGANVFDIANPVSPQLLAYLPGTNRTFDINKANQGALDLAYPSLARIVTADREAGLKIFSILDTTPINLLLN